jgi:hypothetical protein
MALSRHKSNTPLKKAGIFMGILFCFSFFGGPVSAQRADVPATDRYGNYRSTRMQGNRGVYKQTYWLVVDKDPAGLSCRDARYSGREPSLQRAEVALERGAIIKADHHESDDDAILIVEGQAWLRVIVNIQAMQYDARREERGTPCKCFVRANASSIAPINLTDLTETKWEQ